jgi:uroporphyrinogen decarboxylase
VLAADSLQDIEHQTKKMIDDCKYPDKLIASCGGGMPPGVKTENISSFINTVNSINH